MSSEASHCGPKDVEASQEEQQQVQKLLQTTRTLKMDVCMAVTQMVGETASKGAELPSLDQLCVCVPDA